MFHVRKARAHGPWFHAKLFRQTVNLIYCVTFLQPDFVMRHIQKIQKQLRTLSRLQYMTEGSRAQLKL